MSAAIEVIQNAIDDQRAQLERVEEETHEAREAGRIATQRWEAEKRTLADLELGLAALEADAATREADGPA